MQFKDRQLISSTINCLAQYFTYQSAGPTNRKITTTDQGGSEVQVNMGFEQTASLSLLDKYDPQVREIAAGMAKSGKKPPQDFDIDEVRAHPEKYRLPCWVDSGNWNNVCDYPVTSKDGSVFMVRVYRPESKKYGIGPFPAHLNFHGTPELLNVTMCSTNLTRRWLRARGLRSRSITLLQDV